MHDLIQMNSVINKLFLNKWTASFKNLIYQIVHVQVTKLHCVFCYPNGCLVFSCPEPPGNYRKGTSIRQAPVFRHLRALRKSRWKFIIWMNEL